MAYTQEKKEGGGGATGNRQHELVKLFSQTSMPKYIYTAKSLAGETKSGEMEAKDPRQLSQALRLEGFVLIKAKLFAEAKKKGFRFSLPSFGGVPLAEKIFFTKNLQVMVSSGLSLPRSLRTLSLQAKSRKFSQVLRKVEEEINRGKSLSDSLADYPGIFSELFLNMVRVGEESGGLDESLKNLSLQMEREYDLRSKIKGAMIYPAVLITAMIGVGVLMLVMVVPQLAATFKELKIDLPLTTKAIIGLADFLTKRWYASLIIPPALFFIFWRAVKTDRGKKIMDIFLLKIPIAGPIVKNANSAYSARTLSSLISSGVPLPRSLEIVSRTLPNFFFKEALNRAAERVRKGEKLSESLEPYKKIIPLTFVQMVSVGEETGETAKILAQLADFYEEEVKEKTKNLVSALEPVLMLVIGSVIGFFAISMIQPMYSMLDSL